MSSTQSFTRYLLKESTTTTTGGSIALVTGGRSGIGKAIASKIATFPFIDKVLIVSRSVKSDDLVSEDPKFVAVPADITTPEGRTKVIAEVDRFCTRGGESNSSSSSSRRQLRFLIHSAGTIDPIKPIREITPTDLRNALATNLEAPFFLSTALYDYMIPPSSSTETASGDTTTTAAGRILHVSSGSAHGAPPVGWSVYGITKAAFYQSFKVLDRELSHIDPYGTGKGGGFVRVGSFKPGVVDTSMQGSIRSAPTDSMPIVSNFQKMKDNVVDYDPTNGARPPPKGALDSPENVAYFVEWLLLGTTDDEFANRDDPNEYDVRDASLYPKWIPKENIPAEE